MLFANKTCLCYINTENSDVMRTSGLRSSKECE